MTTKFAHLSEEARDQLAELTMNLANSKEARPGFLKLVKQVAPGTPIPELDTQVAVDAALAEERKARETFEAEQRERWLQEDLGRKKNAIKDQYKLSDEDMTAMEKQMTEKKLPADYEWAAKLFRQENEVASPTNYGASGYGPADVKNYMSSFEGLLEDEANWSARTAHQMIDDMQKRGAAKAW